MLLSDYIIIPESVEEINQEDFSVIYDSSQYNIPSRNTGINYYVTKDDTVVKENSNEEEEVITFSL